MSLSIKRHNIAENPNPYFPTATNVLFEGVHTCQLHADGMPMLTPVRQRNRRENDLELEDVKFIGDESPPWTIQRPSGSTPEVRFVIDKLLKFSGYAHEDACKFLNEFNSYCVFHDMNSSE